jgi:transcriptional regulator with XRE-family HTH domain
MTEGAGFDARLGAAIREARLEAGYTQEEVARVLKVTPATIARYELGIRRLSVGTLLQIAAALDMPLSQLVPGAEQLERTISPALPESPQQRAVQTVVRVLEEHPDVMAKVLETIEAALADGRRDTDEAIPAAGHGPSER